MSAFESKVALYSGNSLAEWTSHFKLSAKTGEALNEFGVENLEDVIPVVEDSSLLEEFQSKITKIEFSKFRKAVTETICLRDHAAALKPKEGSDTSVGKSSEAYVLYIG